MNASVAGCAVLCGVLVCACTYGAHPKNMDTGEVAETADGGETAETDSNDTGETDTAPEDTGESGDETGETDTGDSAASDHWWVGVSMDGQEACGLSDSGKIFCW